MRNINEDIFQYSQWIISNNEIKNFERTAKESLLNKSFRNYIEEKSDEDRECGELKNIEK